MPRIDPGLAGVLRIIQSAPDLFFETEELRTEARRLLDLLSVGDSPLDRPLFDRKAGIAV